MDVSKMGRLELAKLAETLDSQIQAYSGSKLSTYAPHPNQVLFHKSNARIRMMVTGNRGGKTTSSVLEAIQLCLGIHPYHPRRIPLKGKFYGESYSQITQAVIPKFIEWLPKSYLNDSKPYAKNQLGQIVGVNFKNGSIIWFGTYDQQTDKAEGTDYDFVAFDEPPPRELYTANLRGIVDRGGIMWFSMTPLKEAWIHDALWVPGITGQKKFIECFNWSSDQNPYIDKQALSMFFEELTDDEKSVRFYGNFAKLQGVVIDTYDQFSSDIEPFDLDESYSIYEGIDPHSRKPNAVLWKAIDKDGLRYVVRELYLDAGIYDLGVEIAKIRNELREFGCEIVKSVSDTSLNQKDMMFKMNQRQELNRALRECGETLMPALAQKRDWLHPGIQKLRDLYRTIPQRGFDRPVPMQYIFKGCCPKYKWELGHYQWPDGVNDKSNPVDTNNDLIDCDRYIESLAPSYQTPGQSSIIRNNSRAYSRLSPSEMEMSRFKNSRSYQ